MEVQQMDNSYSLELEEFLQKLNEMRTPENLVGLPATTLPEIVKIEPENLVTEVMKLFKRIQGDINETNERIVLGRLNISEMESQLQNMNEKHLLKLAEAVQREHEMSVNDIEELTWHVTYGSMVEKNRRNRTDAVSDVNRLLKREVSKIHADIPYVEDKIQQELNNMADIDRQQEEVRMELTLVEMRLQKISDKNTVRHERADEDRELMTQELENAKAARLKVIGECEAAEALYQDLVESMKPALRKLDANHETQKILQDKLDGVKTEVGKLESRIQDLKARIKAREAENSESQSQVTQAVANFNQQKLNCENAIQHLEAVMAESEEEIRRQESTIEVIEADLEWKERKLHEAIKRTEWCERQKTIIDNQTVVAAEESQDTSKRIEINKGLVFQSSKVVNVERDRLKAIEDHLKRVHENWKQKLQVEIHSRQFLALTVERETQKYMALKGVLSQSETAHHKAHLDVMSAVNNLETKVFALREIHAKNQAEMDGILSVLHEIMSQYQHMEGDLQGKVDSLTSLVLVALERKEKLDKNIGQLFLHHKLQLARLADLQNNNANTVKNIKQADRDAKKLEIKMSETQANLRATKRFNEAYRKSLEETMARIVQENETHTALMESRRTVLGDLKVKLDLEIQRNTELASNYRKLHNALLILKEHVFNKHSKIVLLEETVKDLKDLKLLQGLKHDHTKAYYYNCLMLGQKHVQQAAITISNNSEVIDEKQRIIQAAVDRCNKIINL